jgi:hypothetical protein
MKDKVEMIENAERAVIKRAEAVAYMHSDKTDDHTIQTALYEMVKHYIILGARMMEEELMKLGYYETEEEAD